MAITSYPFESLNTGTESAPVYDRAITAEDERLFNKLRYTNGVFAGVGEALAVTLNNGMSINVGTGGGHIEGALFYNTSAMVLTLEAPNSAVPNQNRIDRVVAQFNTSTNVRAVNIIVRTGTQAVNPVAPELRRESNLYEIALADIYVRNIDEEIFAENITDQRLNNELCGFVHPAMPGSIETSDLYKQYEASLQKWLDTVAAALDDSLAGQLLNRVSAVEDQLGTLEEDIAKTVWPISQGGTGADTRGAGIAGLTTILAEDTIDKTDTPATWREIGTGLISLSAKTSTYTLRSFLNLPDTITIGFLLNLVWRNDVRQVIIEDPSFGAGMYIRETDYVNGNPNAWGKWAPVERANWFSLSDTKGTWEYIDRCVVRDKVIVKGYASAYKWSGSSNDVFATVFSDTDGELNNFKPSTTQYAYAHCGGQRIARVALNTKGQLAVDWIINIKDGSAYTSETWLKFQFEYYLD